MRNYKKVIGLLMVLFVVLMMQACGNDDMKYIEQCIDTGNYQYIHIVVNELEIKETGKIGDLIADINNYNTVKSLLDSQSVEGNLEKAKRQILGFNGSYKKYSSFKKDVKELEERIIELENHRNEIEEIIQKIQDSYDDLDYETMSDLFTEYKTNEALVSDTSREQSDRLESLIQQAEFDLFWNDIMKDSGFY